MTTTVDFSNDFPMPKNHAIRCANHHLGTARYQSPIRYPQCDIVEVVWLKPPTLKFQYPPSHFLFPSGKKIA